MPAPPGNPRTYDVCYAVPGGRFFRRPYHGFTLSDDAIAYAIDDRPCTAPLANIVAVHLQTAGAPQSVINQCTITFADGVPFTVSTINSSGMPDSKQLPIYADFVRDLHARLAARGPSGIRFTAGLPPWRYNGLFVASIVAGLLFVGGPLVILAVWADLAALGFLAGGVALCWPLAIMLMKNKPHDYAPDQLPAELLS